MADLNLSTLTEADIITKRVMPAILDAGWNDTTQIRQEVKLRDGKVIVRGKVAARRKVKSADIVLYHKLNMPLAVIEAKANKHEIGKGMQQALGYAHLLDVPFAFASNGDGFIFHDKTSTGAIEREITLDEFPTPDELWQKYCRTRLLQRRQRETAALLSASSHQQNAGSRIRRAKKSIVSHGNGDR